MKTKKLLQGIQVLRLKVEADLKNFANLMKIEVYLR